MKIASRYDEKYKFEKCPLCKEIGGGVPFHKFMIGDLPVLICAKKPCRALWVPSTFDLESLIVPEYKCTVCGKSFGKAIALAGHMRGKCGKRS